jgi:hypothetical protein
MDEIRLPQHVVNRFERRWTAEFAQMVGEWQRLERAPSVQRAGGIPDRQQGIEHSR